MQHRIDALTLQLGGAAALSALPAPVLALALSHGDDVLAVTPQSPDIAIDDLDLDSGYTMLDAEHDELYRVETLTEAVWGRDPLDFAWLLEARRGDYLYLAYASTTGIDRVLLLLRG